jgi:hypothetical protein
MLGTKRRTYHHREATGRRHGHSRHRSPHGLLERLLPNDAVCVMVRCRWSGKSRESSWESRLTLRSEGGVEVGRRLWGGVHCRFARKAPSASQKERRASRSGRVFGRVMPVSDSRWMKWDGGCAANRNRAAVCNIQYTVRTNHLFPRYPHFPPPNCLPSTLDSGIAAGRPASDLSPFSTHPTNPI